MKNKDWVDMSDYMPDVEPQSRNQMPAITDVEIHPYVKHDASNFLGYANVTFCNCLVVRGLKIHNGRYGLFVTWPKERGKNGEWYGTTFPITTKFYRYVAGRVLLAYKNYCNGVI